MIEVKLSADEMYQAAIIGAQRRITCMFGRNADKRQKDRRNNNWTIDIEACGAEIAVAKLLNKYWIGGSFDGQQKYDVANKQVRHTPHDNGVIYIYPRDDPSHEYILVTGIAPDFKIIGSILGKTVQNLGYTHDWWLYPKAKLIPSWWVPQSALMKLKEDVG